MKNRYYPQDPEKVAESLKELARAEAEYLKACRKHEILMARSIPMLAAQQYALQEKRIVEMMLIRAYEHEPLLAALPLREMKVNLIMAKYPDAEQKLRAERKLGLDTPHLYPVPPKQ